MTRRTAMSVTFALLTLGAACSPSGPFAERFRATSPHERYERRLADAGLDESPLGRDWNGAARQALAAPAPASLPLREAVYFDAAAPGAAAWRVRLRDGQRLTVVATSEGAAPAALFVDVFRLDDAATGAATPATAPRRVASADSGALVATAEARDDGAYVVRVQPELLRSVRAVVTISTGPMLAFPVSGRDARAVQSFFGAERDAGKRSHEGIDVFAARGTPALAATPGLVTRVGTDPLGGNVVFLRDPARGQTLYYAHLDRQLVHAGQVVSAGDTLGLVGNTGNARTTPSHLHFGIYRDHRAVDPFPFVDDRRTPPAPIVAREAAGEWRRTAAAGASLAAGPATRDARGPVLPRYTVVRVDGAVADRVRVSLPDGRSGYLAARDVEPLATPVGALESATPLRDRPLPGATIMDVSAPRAPVVGRFGAYAAVRDRRGRLGWAAVG